MNKLAATSTRTLDKTLFRNVPLLDTKQLKKWHRAIEKNGQKPEVDLHPAIAKVAIDLNTVWSSLGLGESISREPATYPAVSELKFNVWNEDNGWHYLDSIRQAGHFDAAEAYDESGEVEVWIRNPKGSPVTLGQLLQRFCNEAEDIGWRFVADEETMRPRLGEVIFWTWDSQSFFEDEESDCLALQGSMWFWTNYLD